MFLKNKCLISWRLQLMIYTNIKGPSYMNGTSGHTRSLYPKSLINSLNSFIISPRMILHSSPETLQPPWLQVGKRVTLRASLCPKVSLQKHPRWLDPSPLYRLSFTFYYFSLLLGNFNYALTGSMSTNSGGRFSLAQFNSIAQPWIDPLGPAVGPVYQNITALI